MRIFRPVLFWFSRARFSADNSAGSGTIDGDGTGVALAVTALGLGVNFGTAPVVAGVGEALCVAEPVLGDVTVTVVVIVRGDGVGRTVAGGVDPLAVLPRPPTAFVETITGGGLAGASQAVFSIFVANLQRL